MGVLALNGGSRAFKGSVLQWPVFDKTEETNLLESFRNNQWWYGDKVRQFEQEYARIHDCEYGITCVNGTVALEVGLRALGIGPGDEVIVPDYTFVATASAVATLNAIPRFADVDLDTANINFESAEKLVTPHTRAIIVVHFAGRPVDLDRARAFADKHNLALMEDAAHAWGSQWHGKGVGSVGDLATFSFQVSKNLTAGEGGIIISNKKAVADACRSYTNCGRTEGHPWYQHYLLGGNYRITELQAAILLAQLARLEDHTTRREQNAMALDKLLRQIPGIKVAPCSPGVTRRSYHMYMFNYLEKEFGGLTREKFLAALNAEGIPATQGYLHPVHTNPCFLNLRHSPRPENAWLSRKCNERKVFYDEVSSPNAARLCNSEMVWLPHALLLGNNRDMEQIAEAIEKIQNNQEEIA